MIPYLVFAKKSFVKNMAYRTEVWLRVFANLTLIFIQVSIWKSLIVSGDSSGVTIEEMITYSVITTATMSLLMTNVYRPIDEKLKSGSITVDLQKPISYPLQLFADQIGLVIFQFTFTVIPSLVISAYVFGIQLPNSTNVLPFIVGLIISIVLSFLLGFLIALISFWILTTFALSWTIKAFVTVFSGSFVPLWFFNPFWLKIADLLPFKYLGYIPTSIYLNKIDNLLSVLTIGACWIVLLFLLNLVIWKLAIRDLVVQGG